ncbi:GAF domain-containing protein [Solicola gregarius]|uniref:Transcriptional regulator n=1 Tax=Solicola gregarius TaxID=2908642 RepID=A0AA46YNJ1_9ACTN|nr:GAF domain-containing protein [Solicola gregarius]UYM06748.1 transcriptional regulator [Solicola gregarius]
MSYPDRQVAAYPHGVDPAAWGRLLHMAHDDFLSTGRSTPQVRPIVLDSWRRSLRHGVDPETPAAPVRLADDALETLRREHPLGAMMPVIRKLLVDSATDAGLLVAVSDNEGRMLWVEGHAGLRSRAEGMHFIEGADWSEAAVGTNAPGTALALDDAVAIFGAEHLARPVTPWSCSAAPIHDPATGGILGVLDVTGGDEVASAQSLSLVRATVAAVESELRFLGLMTEPTGYDAEPVATSRLETLGLHCATLYDSHRLRRLSLRHSEILVLLADAPDGLTGDELAMALSGREHASVTIRAEMSRLRAVLGSVELASRPYRLESELRTDIHDVRELLDEGDVEAAEAAYRGPVLPQSSAPGVVAVREELAARVGQAQVARR